MKGPWFSNKNFTSLELKKFKSISEHEVVKSITIFDTKVIQNLVKRIEQINPDGDMMKSFGEEAEHIDLSFYSESENKFQVIHIFQKRFKTPSTGFNYGKSELEENLYADIDALLFPDYNKMMLKIENQELIFKDFSITYTGSEFHDAFPATVSFTRNKFILKDKNKKEQVIEIVSGQLPPPPFIARLNQSTIEIHTHRKQNNEILYPDYFQVIAIDESH